MRRRVLLLLAVPLLFLAACGAEAMTARDWAVSVCGTLGPWRQRIAELTGGAQAAIKPDSTPQTAKEELVKLIQGAAGASSTAHDALAKLPAPDVEGGADVRDTFVAALATARDAYGQAAGELSGLDASAADFYDRVSAVMTRLNSAYSAGPDPATLDSKELKEAFDAVPECR